MENNAQTETKQEIDYKAEYEKVIAERDGLKTEVDKQKKLKDQYASENAEYKRKADAQMTEEEKKAKELQEIIDSKNKAEAELAQMRLERECLTNGFTAEETEKLVNGKFAVKDIAEIVKSRVDDAVKSAKAELTKNSTSQELLGKGSADGNTKSEFQKRQESRQKSSTVVEL